MICLGWERENEKQEKRGGGEKKKKDRACSEKESGLCFIFPFLLLHSFVCELSLAFLPFLPLSFFNLLHTQKKINALLISFSSCHFCFIIKVMQERYARHTISDQKERFKEEAVLVNYQSLSQLMLLHPYLSNPPNYVVELIIS